MDAKFIKIWKTNSKTKFLIGRIKICLNLKRSSLDLAEKIIRLYNNSELQKKVYIGAKEYAYQTSFKEIAKKHLEVYKIKCLN